MKVSGVPITYLFVSIRNQTASALPLGESPMYVLLPTNCTLTEVKAQVADCITPFLWLLFHQ